MLLENNKKKMLKNANSYMQTKRNKEKSVKLLKI